MAFTHSNAVCIPPLQERVSDLVEFVLQLLEGDPFITQSLQLLSQTSVFSQLHVQLH